MSWKKSFNNRYLFDRLSNNNSELFDLTMNNIMDNFYDSAMNTSTDGKFKAVCLSGIRTEANNGEGVDANDAQLTGDYISIIVRPLSTFGDILPDPRTYSDSSMINSTISLHASVFTARSDYKHDSTSPISFGQIIDCYFEKGSIRDSNFNSLRFSEPQDAQIEKSFETLATIKGVNTLADSDWSSAFLLGTDDSELQFPPKKGNYVGSNVNFRETIVENGKISNQLLGKATKGSINKPTMLQEIVSSYDRMAEAFNKRFPTKQLGAWGYRTYNRQVKLKEEKPRLAATPGTSNHGWGLAIDVHYFETGKAGALSLDYSGDEYRWLNANSSQYGWTNPQWARQGGGKEEPWHWEWSNKDSIIRGIK